MTGLTGFACHGGVTPRTQRDMVRDFVAGARGLGYIRVSTTEQISGFGLRVL